MTSCTPEQLEALRARARADGREISFISAQDGVGVEELVERMWRLYGELDRNEPLVRYREEIVFDEQFPDIEVVWTHE